MALSTSSRAKKKWARGGANLVMHDDQDNGGGGLVLCMILRQDSNRFKKI
jgi:hypothetical protein